MAVNIENRLLFKREKYLLIVLGLSLAFFSVLYYQVFLQNPVIELEKEKEQPPIEQILYPGRLSFSLEKENFNVGETFLAKVLVDPGQKKTVGADVVLEYDPNFLELIEEDGKFVDFSESIFDLFPVGRYDSTTGEIRFSALISAHQPALGGGGIVGTLKFKALKQGDTELSFVYEFRSTTDSNIAFKGKDILGKVVDAKIKILE